MVIADIILYEEVLLQGRSLFHYDEGSLLEDSHIETRRELQVNAEAETPVEYLQTTDQGLRAVTGSEERSMEQILPSDLGSNQPC